MLRLEKISKQWGDFAHREIDLEVRPGEFFVLLGPSGAGKTLLLELIAGFHRPDSGRIRIAGRDVTALPPERRNVGFVYQDQMLFPHRTVRRNIAYGLKARGVGREETRRRVGEMTEMLHLEETLDRMPTKLSVGQRQRVSLARALAIRPELLLLDEPFAALDRPLKERLWSELRQLHQRTGVAVLHVTHDRDEAVVLAQRVGVIRDGRIRQVGKELSVFERPNSAFVASFTGGRNVYEGSARRDGKVTIFRSGGVEMVSGTERVGPCRAMVRPENIIISMEPIHTSARNCIPCEVDGLTRRGGVYEVTAHGGELSMTCVVTPLSVEELKLEPGAQVYYVFKAGSVHLFACEGERESSDDDLA